MKIFLPFFGLVYIIQRGYSFHALYVLLLYNKVYIKCYGYQCQIFVHFPVMDNILLRAVLSEWNYTSVLVGVPYPTIRIEFNKITKINLLKVEVRLNFYISETTYKFHSSILFHHIDSSCHNIDFLLP